MIGRILEIFGQLRSWQALLTSGSVQYGVCFQTTLPLFHPAVLDDNCAYHQLCGPRWEAWLPFHLLPDQNSFTSQHPAIRAVKMAKPWLEDLVFSFISTFPYLFFFILSLLFLLNSKELSPEPWLEDLVFIFISTFSYLFISFLFCYLITRNYVGRAKYVKITFISLILLP